MGGGKMSPEAQRIAIAEACGWEHIVFNRGWIKAGDGKTQCVIPDYLNDLNAMHEAEEVMTEMQRCDYSNHLYDLARRHQEVTEKWRYLSMSAAQRAEAFLRTLGKWEDEQ
jgi:hypothetical protein